MIRIEVTDPYGLTGSEDIDGLYVYYSKDYFTKDTLPTPDKNNTTSFSGYAIDLPEKDTPYWIMWAYRGRDNQMTYSPIVSWIDWSDETFTLFGGRPGFTYGDAQLGLLNSVLSSQDRVDILSFGEDSGILWIKPTRTPMWFIDKGVINGACAVPEIRSVTAPWLYKNGYFGKDNSTMEDTLTPELITLMGGPKPQSRIFTTARASFKTWVPTLDEFKSIIGTLFQSGIPTDKPAISSLQLVDDIWYLTSTQSTGNQFWVINSNGSVKEIDFNENIAVHMLYSLEIVPH